MTVAPLPTIAAHFRTDHMHRSLSFLLPLVLAVTAPAQEVPGVRASLHATRTLVAAGGTVELRLSLQIDADTQIPGDLLTGVDLTTTIGDGSKGGDKEGPQLREAGKGGTVAVAKGTRIERTLSFPSERFVPNADPSALTYVDVSWRDLAGASCVFKIAPDSRKLDVATLDLAKTKVVLVTNHGEMTLSFRPDKAPKTVESFVKLCASGFYDGTKFHRVIRNFMVQGGDPNTKDDAKPEKWGQGGPGFTIPAEFNDMKHLANTVAMARVGNDPNSAGSQFFIVHKDAPHLDGQYTAFGNLESGVDTLNSIANSAVTGPQQSLPVRPVVLHAAIVLPAKK